MWPDKGGQDIHLAEVDPAENREIKKSQHADHDAGKHNFHYRKIFQIEDGGKLPRVPEAGPFEDESEDKSDEYSQLKAVGEIKPSILNIPWI